MEDSLQEKEVRLSMSALGRRGSGAEVSKPWPLSSAGMSACPGPAGGSARGRSAASLHESKSLFSQTQCPPRHIADDPSYREDHFALAGSLMARGGHSSAAMFPAHRRPLCVCPRSHSFRAQVAVGLPRSAVSAHLPSLVQPAKAPGLRPSRPRGCRTTRWSRPAWLGSPVPLKLLDSQA